MFAALFLAALLPQQELSYQDLLDDLTDLRRLTQLPQRGERAVQFSSYDRRSQAGPEDPEAWFANQDRGNYLREEATPRGTEYVMAESEGPGVVTRIWSANPSGELRFYIDGATDPTYQIAFQDLCRGEFPPFLEPLCGQRGKGWNCYVPFPYQKSLKITATAGDLYYHVNVRRFGEGTTVPSFDALMLSKHGGKLRRTGEQLLSRELFPVPQNEGSLFHELDPGKPFGMLLQGRGTVRQFTIKIHNLDQHDDPAVLLRKIRMTIKTGTLATQPKVDVPLGDFFGTGPGVNPYQGYPLGQLEDGTFYCNFPMPFEQIFEVRLTAQEHAECDFDFTYAWDDEVSGDLRFFAGWKQKNSLKTRPYRDFRIVRTTGPGRFVGCVLTIRNLTKTWWGEGDEKFYVDNEEFPSTFGTGTEDYFGYAWGSNEVFSHPLHSQSRCDGPGNYGYTSVNRFQLADAVPFRRTFKFDMEVWHWEERKIDLAATAYWYARGSASHDFPPLPDALRRLPRRVPEYKPYAVEGALEAESLEVLERTGGETTVQDMAMFGNRWSQEQQLWWTKGQPGDRLVLGFEVPQAGSYELVGHFTKARDYGIIAIGLDGKATGKRLDLFVPDRVVAEEISLGTHSLNEGMHQLELMLEGKNEAAVPAYMAGLDYLLLRPVASDESEEAAGTEADSLYSQRATSLEGDTVGLSDYAGKVTLVVNVASQCGYTPQYAGLQKLHEEFASRGFSVLGFPSNEFGAQEPGSALEIRKFCSENYDVSFPMFSKVEVKPGEAQAPVYRFLTRGGEVPNWNFCKYLVGKDGQPIAFYRSRVAPESAELRAAIEQALAAP